MENYKRRFATGPKLVTIYRHVGAYEEVEVDGEKMYRVLFRKNMNGGWYTLDVSPKEVAAFVDMNDRTVLEGAKEAYPSYLVNHFGQSTQMRALDAQMQDLGEGFNSSWQPYEINGFQVGFVNEDLMIVALYSPEDMALRLRRSVEVEHGGYRFDGMCEEHKFSRIVPSVWGAAPDYIDTQDQADEFAQVVLKWGADSYFREVEL